MKNYVSRFLLTTFLLCTTVVAHAQYLDYSFGINGSNYIRPDIDLGRILSNKKEELFLIRNAYQIILVQKLTPNGFIDSTYGDDGIVDEIFFPGLGWTSFAHAYDDGSVLISGYYTTKINPSGVQDTSFGNKGKAEFILSAGQALPNEDIIGFQPYVKNSKSYIDIIKVHKNGDMDSAFINTVRQLNLDTNYIFRNLCLTNDQQIILYGVDTSKPLFPLNLMIKLKTNGELDSSFGQNGIHTFSLRPLVLPQSHGIKYISAHKDGSYYLITGGQSNHSYGIVKLHSNLTIDSTFGKGGILYRTNNSEKSFFMSNGDILIFLNLASDTSSTVSHFTICGADSNGRVNYTFNTHLDSPKVFHYDDVYSYSNTYAHVTNDKIVQVASGRGRHASKLLIYRFDFYNNHTSIARPIVDDGRINIYPNPISHYLNIETREPILQLSIINQFGQVMATEKIIEKSVQLDLSNWSHGLYYIDVLTASGRQLKKIIKQ